MIKQFIYIFTLFIYISFTSISFAQETTDGEEEVKKTQSVIQTYTPSKLLANGQWDIKWFNNLYTETKTINEDGVKSDRDRQNFFTSSVEIFTGINQNKVWNVGVIIEYRSNTTGGQAPLDVLKFGNKNNARSGLTSIAPSIKVAPFKSLNNFSILSSFSFPTFKQETLDGVFLDQKGYTWQNRIFFDQSISDGMFQLFAELNTEYNFGNENESFANDSFRVTPGLFFSYFPNQKVSLLALSQYSKLFDISNNFSQSYATLGTGVKYQMNTAINLEFLYTSFVTGRSTGLGETFSFGLRALF